jgi:hypothetical protein
MAQITPQYAEALQKKHGFKFWRVYDRSKKEIDNNTRDISLGESVNLLQETLNNITGDLCYVTFLADETKKGGKQPERLDVTIRCNDGVVNRKETALNGVSISDFMALQEKLFETRLKLETARLEQPAESGKITMVEKFLSYAMEKDLIPAAIGAITTMRNKPEINQAPEVNGPDQLAETLKKFSQVDPTYQETLKKMADYLQKNPGVLPQIKSIIGA